MWFSQAPGNGKWWDFEIVKNGSVEASSRVRVTQDDQTGSATGLTIDVAPGDTFSIKVSPSGTTPPSNTQARWGVVLKADKDGESVMAGSASGNLLTNGDRGYARFVEHGSSWNTSETGGSRLAMSGKKKVWLKDFRVKLSGAPGAGKSYTFGIRKNQAAGNSSVTISDTDTEGVDSVGQDKFTLGDLLSVTHTSSGTPTARTADWSAVQYRKKRRKFILIF